MPRHNNQDKPIAAILVPFIPDASDIQDKEVMTLVASHRKVAIADYKKARLELYPAPLYLGADGERDNAYRDRDIRKIVGRLANEGSEIKVVAHGSPDEIGTLSTRNITAEELTGFFASVFPEDNRESIKLTIDLQTCNSGYYANDASDSFAGKFWTAMHDVGFAGVVVKGYRGFTGEVDNKKRAYVTGKFGDTKNIIRSTEAQLIIAENGDITPPKRNFPVSFGADVSLSRSSGSFQDMVSASRSNIASRR